MSWAVDDNGNPVSLTSVRYVRVYTGVMQMNGIMGESSTEVLGSHRVAAKGTGAGSVPTVTLGGGIGSIDLDASANMSVQEYTGLEMDEISVSVSGGTYIFINGEASSTATIDLSDGNEHLVQIIAQNGTASPYIVVLKLAR